MRASMSAIGSVIMVSPARLRDAGQLPAQSHLSQANTAKVEVAVHPSRTATDVAASHETGRKLRGAGHFRPLRCACHPVQLLKGIPSCARSSLASSLVLAVVTMVMFIPLILSTLSKSI